MVAQGMPRAGRKKVGVFGGRLTSDPNRSSLGLLPSGPDPVGEWLVHRQPPAFISAERSANASGGRPQNATPIRLRARHITLHERRRPSAPIIKSKISGKPT